MLALLMLLLLPLSHAANGWKGRDRSYLSRTRAYRVSIACKGSSYSPPRVRPCEHSQAPGDQRLWMHPRHSITDAQAIARSIADWEDAHDAYDPDAYTPYADVCDGQCCLCCCRDCLDAYVGDEWDEVDDWDASWDEAEASPLWGRETALDVTALGDALVAPDEALMARFVKADVSK